MSDDKGGKPYRSNVQPFPKHNLQRFRTVSPTQWEGIEPEPVRWLVEGLIARQSVILFSGDSGLGKSLLMLMLQTSLATGRPWLGNNVERVRSLGFYCEDPEQIIQWRQRQIVRHLGVSESDLDDMLIAPRAGLDNVLMDFQRWTEEGQTTPVFQQLKTECLDFGSQLTVIDTLSHTFNGNENSRMQVTKFLNHLLEIAEATDGAVILCSHPSVTSMQSGSGYSGSTGWKANARGHFYLTRPKKYDDEDPNAEHDIRYLKTKKNNWGKDAGMIKLRWNDGVFEPVQEEPKKAAFSQTAKSQLNIDIMKAVRYFMKNDQKMAVNSMARTYIVKLLMGLPTTKDYERGALVNAIERLDAEGKLVQVELGPPSQRAMFYRDADSRYPGEK